jgi:hypothetical protein
VFIRKTGDRTGYQRRYSFGFANLKEKDIGKAQSLTLNLSS